MSVERHVYKVRTFACPSCGDKIRLLRWDYDPVPQCPSCSSPMTSETFSAGQAPAVHGDEMDEVIEHGVCHDDGTPRRFTSKAELRRVEVAKGWRRYEPGDERVGKEQQERAVARFARAQGK